MEFTRNAEDDGSPRSSSPPLRRAGEFLKTDTAPEEERLPAGSPNFPGCRLCFVNNAGVEGLATPEVCKKQNKKNFYGRFARRFVGLISCVLLCFPKGAHSLKMSDFHNRSQSSARRSDYVWQYEYYDDEEPVSFEGLKAHRCKMNPAADISPPKSPFGLTSSHFVQCACKPSP